MDKKLQEKHRLVFILKAALNTAEECIPKLREGFINDEDYSEMRKAVAKTSKEIMEIDAEIVEGLDK